MWIAELRESSNLRTQTAPQGLPLGHICLRVMKSLCRGPFFDKKKKRFSGELSRQLVSNKASSAWNLFLVVFFLTNTIFVVLRVYLALNKNEVKGRIGQLVHCSVWLAPLHQESHPATWLIACYANFLPVAGVHLSWSKCRSRAVRSTRFLRPFFATAICLRLKQQIQEKKNQQQNKITYFLFFARRKKERKFIIPHTERDLKSDKVTRWIEAS